MKYETYRGFHPLVRNVLLRLFPKSCESLLGQYVASVAANRVGEFSKSSSSKPCNSLDENRCITLTLALVVIVNCAVVHAPRAVIVARDLDPAVEGAVPLEHDTVKCLRALIAVKNQ